jgi:small subunit ribosomal protein S1
MAWSTCLTCHGTAWQKPLCAIQRVRKLETIILAVVDRERITLGIKQLDSDPFTTLMSINDGDAIVTGKVKTVDKGAEIDLVNIIGYLRASGNQP